ncbi:Galactosylgalactosylxylosylprotein 3-beta-glucuronosyltransferase [Caenorhabditis elegans]|uniref:Galactosylgalactosylxylosylprotein 3-beta-glucuronosyltransferase n=1 Tax=Caenorhabditis elegans TaxID=6239 RepID=O17751_CAEEL|nr:Galactosylgalactosylxylosylprotein 3-beta-glucuronosyltransferase [Caenorhabditis elegans]CAB04033.3 Galactosylgalactosylxylosylprotein 3-beta-glucuronosyltransferase [Caenorhabditis elegans]
MSVLKPYGTLLVYFVFFVMVIVLYNKYSESFSSNRRIIVITPTYRRITRMPDITRMSNTLKQIKNLHWIVIEDGEELVPAVQNVLERSGLPYTYVTHKTAKGYPAKGWYQRDMALKMLRTNSSQILGNHKGEAVVYFADDDNSYDLRLFDDFIRNVKKLGVWAVGLVGGTIVEAPKVENKKVTSFNVKWEPSRPFAVDMAGFAINLKYILRSAAVFGPKCHGSGAPETCLLEKLGFELDDIQPFGYEKEEDKEILVWHTRTSIPKSGISVEDDFGYFVEVG